MEIKKKTATYVSWLDKIKDDFVQKYVIPTQYIWTAE